MRAGWSQRWSLPAVFTAAVLTVIAAGRGTAAMIEQFFPEGVPAYDAAPGVTVRSRLRPDDEPAGMHIGSFVLRPQLESGVGYDTNPGSADHGSWFVRNQPSLWFGSDWSRDALGGYVSAADTRYLDRPRQSRTDLTISLGGALDIGRDRLSIGFAHLTQHEDGNRLDALRTDRPIAFTLDNARISYTANFDRWSLTPSIELSQWRFDATTIRGAPASQRYRDRDVVQGAVTLRYEIAPLRSLLLVGRVIGQDYPNTPAGQPSLNSTGYQLLAGFDYDDDAVWRYRLLLGGEVRQFVAFQSHADFIAEAEVAWMPSGLTTVRALLSRSIEDATQEGVAGFTYTAGKLTIDHEYRRDLMLTASIGLQHADFLQGGSQDGYSFGLGATWFVNRRLRLSATYDLTGYGDGHGLDSSQVLPSTRSLAMLVMRLGL